MTFEELQAKHIELQTSFALAQNDKTAMLEENKTLKNNVVDLQKQASAAKASIDELTAKQAKLESDLANANKLNNEQQKQIVESQVAADIALLNEFITPAENSADNNFKLKRDLTHLKLNEATLTDADGNSLYQAKINEIKNRKSNSILKKELGAAEKPVDTKDVTKLNYNNLSDQAVIVEEAKKLAEAEKIPFAEALIKLSAKFGEGM